MFEILRDETLNAVISSIYYAMRLLKHRYPDMSPARSYAVPGVASEPSPEAQALAWRLLHEIEAKEGVPIARLDRSRCDFYIGELYEALQERTSRDLPFDTEKARKALDGCAK